MTFNLFGGPRGIRTPDLLNAIETRSQLRYGPGIIMNTFVDLRGFEPLTFSVRLRRAPNCATGPNSKCRVFYLSGFGMSITPPASLQVDLHWHQGNQVE